MSHNFEASYRSAGPSALGVVSVGQQSYYARNIVKDLFTMLNLENFYLSCGKLDVINGLVCEKADKDGVPAQVVKPSSTG